MRTGLKTKLDPNKRSSYIEEFEAALKKKVVGQDQAVGKLVEVYQTFSAGLQTPNRPIGNLLFLGPSGVGKTRSIEAMAELLFNNSKALLKVDCAEFQHSHEVAKLVGSPPGYLGHRETHPMLTQETLNQYHTDTFKFTLLLFDEIEKASDSLWKILLGIMDKAVLTLGDNRKVDFSNCLIILTSNVGAGDIVNAISGGMGFRNQSSCTNSEDVDKKIARVANEAVKRKFSPEFIGRLDKIIAFNTLKIQHLEEIIEIELGMIQNRVLQNVNNRQFVFSCTPKVKKHLLNAGVSTNYGARDLKKELERKIVAPLSNLMASEQIRLGDFIRIDIEEDEFTFTREAEAVIGIPDLTDKYADLEGKAIPRSKTPKAKKASTQIYNSRDDF